MEKSRNESQHPQRLLADDWSAFEWDGRAVVAAVSGGADSVALLRMLVGLEENRPRQVIVAHFNHRLRAGSADDARFVADLAGRLELPFELGQADVAALAEQQGDGVEAAARGARYEFLAQVADRHRANFIATGHTADDQAETVLHRILRGTGIAGLQGIHELRPVFGRQDIYLVRPLLSFRHSDVVGYLREIDQPFCEDPSNADPRFTRNRIRHELLPLLERDYNRNVVEALLRLSETASGAQSAIDELVEDLVEEAVAFEEEEVIVNRDMLAGINPHLVRELFLRIWRDMSWPQQQMGLDEWVELAIEGAAELHDDDERESVPKPQDAPYKRMFPGKIMAEKQGAALVLKRPAQSSRSTA